MTTRRKLLRGGATVGAALLGQGLLPRWAAASGRAGISGSASPGLTPALSGTAFHLDIAAAAFAVAGRATTAVAVNGTVPAPLLRWREGDEVTLRVTNHLAEPTSIHWHGILLPFQMDGVPGVSFPGIAPGDTFTYRFPVRQAGTYWYHSHSNLQEQIGHYGPLVIDPAGPDPVAYDREHVLVLSDWTFLPPHRLFGQLKKAADGLNFRQRTLGDLAAESKRDGFAAAMADRLMWGGMRMKPTDVSDVTGATYTYLINGYAPEDNWTGLFRPGERVRLRIINASAMTLFNVRIPDLPMMVVQADGMDVRPVETDEFQIGVAETYDVVVVPGDDRAYTFMCEAVDRSGYARATLAPRLGMAAAVPALRERPLLTMRDMGMAHGNGHGAADGAAGAAMAGSGHQAHGHHHGAPAPQAQSHRHAMGPGVAGTAEQPVSRLHEPGIGLEAVPHRTLAYTDLVSLAGNPDRRPPERELELHLTGNMERYMWSFDGERFTEVVEPIVFHENERVRLTLVNDTMMAHPIHLHGMFFEVVNGAGDDQPRKHTIVVKPAEKLSLDLTADAVGDWAFHCHLLYHMHAGMFRVVSVRPRSAEPA